ncbi:MAG: cytochrome c biogenesis protein CcsA [Bacteroidales bacterium]|nr:cytochrome c biogenesis protein CcsA [Bacteroidales bacterium]
MKKTSVILIVPVVIILAAGTIIEKYHGNAFAVDHVYNSWWFILLLAAVGVACIYTIVRNKLWRIPHQLLLYSSAVVILLGGGLTTWTGQHGNLVLEEGIPNHQCTMDDGDSFDLPFDVTLQRFELMTYPGSKAPMDFVSHVTVEGDNAVISMNNIYRHKGYRFYQADYDMQGGSTLSVAHDPLGIGVTYAGYLLAIVGLMWMFLTPRSHFRRLLRGLPLVLLLLAGNAQAAPTTLPRQSAEKMGQMYVLYKGRICPLQTLAKDFTTKLCGNATYRGLTSEQVLSGWLFYATEWIEEPMIKIKGNELRRQLGMEGRYTSFSNLLAHQELFTSHPLPKELRAADEKLNLVKMVMGSELLKLYPLTDSTGKLNWYSQNDPLPLDVDDDEYIFIRKQLSYCQELVVTGDFTTLNQVFEKTADYQRKQAASALPSPTRIRAERIYNALTTGRWLALLSITLGLVSLAIALYASPRKETNRPSRLSIAGSRVSTLIVALLTLFLIIIFVLRWIAGGHAPMAGGFDSMHLMAIAIGIVALCTARRHRMASSIALMAMGFCLLVAMMSGSNPPITHLMPVLSSPLLTLHVTVIMIAYALFIFAMLGSVATLLRPSLRPSMERTNLLLLYPGVALLAVGIIIGAVWANISWGNYWSWDPKEVWALITLLVYLYPLHMAARKGHSVVHFHLWCLFAFLSVIITYFGVNLLLGGMHAYN